MTDPKTPIVGVLMGGMSSERPISLKSGKAVAELVDQAEPPAPVYGGG